MILLDGEVNFLFGDNKLLTLITIDCDANEFLLGDKVVFSPPLVALFIGDPDSVEE